MDCQESRPAARVRRASAGAIRFAILGSLLAGVPAVAADWQPINPEELQMTREPAAPQAPAIILYRQVDRDDANATEADYLRIKVLTEEGRHFANVEIPYFGGSDAIRGLEARVVQPDGSIVPFDGRVFETTLVKARGVRYLAKTFTLPDVRVGSILEYRFTHRMDSGYVYNSRWILNDVLFTRRAHFSLRPNEYLGLHWSWPRGLPPGAVPPVKPVKGLIQLDVNNVPAFVREEYMPPEDEMKYRVEFTYYPFGEHAADVAEFWRNYGKARFQAIDDFVDSKRAMERALRGIVDPGDSPESKLRKIYARVQQLRNLTYERERTEQEEKREHIKLNRNVGDVWERGYGGSEQLTWLFLALARAAGIQADPVVVSTRNWYFFSKEAMNPRQLNDVVAMVRLDGTEQAFDPGAYLTPYGMLPWSETGVQGLRLDKNGGEWTSIVATPAAASCIARRGALTLAPDGTLSGHLTVTYSGQEALVRRLEEREEDATARRRYLEEEIKASVPVGMEAKLANEPDWSSAGPTLVAEFDVDIPGWGVAAGARMLVPATVFGGAERHTFEHATRVQPMYFSYPFMRDDDVDITLPPGVAITSLPAAIADEGKSTGYSSRAEARDGKLHLQRQLTIRTIYMDVRFYDQLRVFFQRLRAGDEHNGHHPLPA